jgi:DNA-nicking Smr family endonuclease
MATKTKVVTFNGAEFKLSIPTIGSKIRMQAIVQQQTRGMQSFLSASYNQDAINAATLAVTLANLQSNVEKLKKGTQDVDYDFDFFNLEDSQETAELISFLAKELEDFISSFRSESQAK